MPTTQMSLLDLFTEPRKKYRVKFYENGGVSAQHLTYLDFEVDEQGNAWVIFEGLELAVAQIISVK